MKKILYLLLALILASCTADFDEFGQSPYLQFNGIEFEEQDGSSSINESDHTINITLKEVDSIGYDSLTIHFIDLSAFAKLYLVESKIREFPTDIESLDSLAKEVYTSKVRLEVGKKVRLPKSQQLDFVVEAENGKRSLWRIIFKIPGVEPPSSSSFEEDEDYSSSSYEEIISSSTVEDDSLVVESSSALDEEGESSSSSVEIFEDEPESSSSSSSVEVFEDEPESSSSSSSSVEVFEDEPESSSSSSSVEVFDDEPESSSSSVVLSNDVSFEIHFEKELENSVKKDTIVVVFPIGTDLSALKVSSISHIAAMDKDPLKITNWATPVAIQLTAEDGTEKTWYVRTERLKSADTDLTLSFKNQLAINKSTNTIRISLVVGSNLATAQVETLKIPEGATIAPDPTKTLLWLETQNFVVTAENGETKTWTVELSVAEPDYVASTAKELLSINAKGEIEAPTINKSEKTITFHMANADAMAAVNLTLDVSDKASHNVHAALDLRSAQTLTITAEDGSTTSWKLNADYPKSSAADILTFAVSNITTNGNPKINTSAKTISFEVPYSEREKINSINFTATYSEKSQKTSPATNVLNLNSGNAVIVVSAEDGSTVEWNVEVVVAEGSKANDILTFEVGGITPTKAPVINTSKKTVSFEVAYGTDRSNINFRATYSDKAKRLSPTTNYLNASSGSAQIVVASEDGTEAIWTVEVNMAEGSKANDILTFEVGGITPTKAPVINTSAKTVSFEVAYGTDRSNINFRATYSDKAKRLSPTTNYLNASSGSAQIVVASEDGTEAIWTVEVNMAEGSKANDILTFEVGGITPTKAPVINTSAKTVTFEVAYGTDRSNINFRATYSDKAKRLSPTTNYLNASSGSAEIVVVSEDGTEAIWTVEVNMAAGSSENDILTFEVGGIIPTKTPVIDAQKKTVTFEVAYGTDRSNINFRATISDKATRSGTNYLDASSGSAEIIVTAEDGSVATWTVIVEMDAGSSEADILTFAIANANAEIDASKKTIDVLVPNRTDLSALEFTATYSAKAKKTSPTTNTLDARSGSAKIAVTSENGTVVEWTINVTVAEPPAMIRSISLAGKPATIEGDRIVVNDLPFNKDGTNTYTRVGEELFDLSNVEITALELADGATANVSIGSILNVTYGQATITVTQGSESKTYKVKGGYQYPNSDFATWKNGTGGTELDGWDNGNNTMTSSLAVKSTDGKGDGATKMVTTSVLGKLASGNTFTADFNPKNVGMISMLGYADGNELIEFGRPFEGRPEYIEFDAQYDGKTDTCDLYILLENRSAGLNALNQNRAADWVNTLVASAWFRATTIEEGTTFNRPLPDLVSVKPAEAEGFYTIRLKLNYGMPKENSPIENSSVLTTTLRNSKGINNGLVSTDSPNNFPVTHIRIVMAASANGNMYEGKSGATLIVDEVRLIY